MFFQRDEFPDVPLEEIVARVRMLVIDDQEFPYLKLFRRDGYNIDKWRDVTRLVDIEQGKFDLILLDLQGVGRGISGADQGLGVLKHIKNVRPMQLVVAYSNAEFPLKYKPFFDLADGVLQKSDDYGDFKRKVDDLLKGHFSVGFHIGQVEQKFTEMGLSGRKGARLAKRVVRSRNVEPMRSYLTRRLGDAVTVERVIAICQLAISVAKLWKS